MRLTMEEEAEAEGANFCLVSIDFSEAEGIISGWTTLDC
jgi:hypothetical protein